MESVTMLIRFAADSCALVRVGILVNRGMRQKRGVIDRLIHSVDEVIWRQIPLGDFIGAVSVPDATPVLFIKGNITFFMCRSAPR